MVPRDLKMVIPRHSVDTWKGLDQSTALSRRQRVEEALTWWANHWDRSYVAARAWQDEAQGSSWNRWRLHLTEDTAKWMMSWTPQGFPDHWPRLVGILVCWYWGCPLPTSITPDGRQTVAEWESLDSTPYRPRPEPLTGTLARIVPSVTAERGMAMCDPGIGWNPSKGIPHSGMGILWTRKEAFEINVWCEESGVPFQVLLVGFLKTLTDDVQSPVLRSFEALMPDASTEHLRSVTALTPLYSARGMIRLDDPYVKPWQSWVTHMSAQNTNAWRLLGLGMADWIRRHPLGPQRRDVALVADPLEEFVKHYLNTPHIPRPSSQKIPHRVMQLD